MEACLQARLIGFEDILGKVSKSSLKHYFQGVIWCGLTTNLEIIYPKKKRMHEKLHGTEDLLAKSEARKKLPDKNLDFQVCKL